MQGSRLFSSCKRPAVNSWSRKVSLLTLKRNLHQSGCRTGDSKQTVDEKQHQVCNHQQLPALLVAPVSDLTRQPGGWRGFWWNPEGQRSTHCRIFDLEFCKQCLALPLPPHSKKVVSSNTGFGTFLWLCLNSASLSPHPSKCAYFVFSEGSFDWLCLQRTHRHPPSQ